MKIKYSYYSLRFPDEIAKLCELVQTELGAGFIDLPFILPVGSDTCTYYDADVKTMEGEKYYIANGCIDVCFIPGAFSDDRYFGVIDITHDTAAFVFWANFFDNRILDFLCISGWRCEVRQKSNPTRITVTLAYGDANV